MSRTSRQGPRPGAVLAAFAAAGLALGLAAQVAGTPVAAARAAGSLAAPAQPSPRPTEVIDTVTGVLVDGDGVCGASWFVRRCGDNALVAVRSDMSIQPFRGSLVRLQGLPATCATNGKGYLWLSSIEPVSDCAAPTPTPTPSAPPPPGPNLAVGRPVFASTDEAPGPARFAVDGDGATAWSSPEKAAWIWVDLGQQRTFDRMRLSWGTPFARRYGIFVREYDEWAFKYEVDSSDGGDDEFVLPRLYGRYVLLYAVESSDPTGGYVLNEWEIHGQETPNLALGQRPEVSDFDDCCPGELATDGRYDTGWVSEARPPLVPGQPTPTPGPRNPWLQIRMPAGTYIDEMRLMWDNVAYPWQYRVVLYDYNNIRAPRRLPFRSQRGGMHIVSWPASLPVKADTVLLYTDELPAIGYIALAELELYGPPESFKFLQLGDYITEGVTVDWPADFLRPGLRRLAVPLPTPIVPGRPSGLRLPPPGASAFPAPDAPGPVER